MNFDLGSNSNKMILLVVTGIALLLALSVYQKQIGKNVAILISVAVIIIVGIFGYRLLNEEDEGEYQENNELNNLLNEEALNANNANVNNANINNANVNNVAELEEESPEEVLEQFASGPTDVKANVNENGNTSVTTVTNNNTLNSGNLLPEGDTVYSNVNPSNNGGVINASLLNAGHHVGVNTQGCSLRNANRGLRSEPANPQTQVSPWQQTTICPDLYRKPLE